MISDREIWLAAIGECAGTAMHMSGASGNKGHGFCLNSGRRTSRVNLGRPGIINLFTCRAQRNGGHALALAEPGTTDAAETVYRVNVQNFECFGNCDDAAVRYFQRQVKPELPRQIVGDCRTFG
jgi:hypothetical protein